MVQPAPVYCQQRYDFQHRGKAGRGTWNKRVYDTIIITTAHQPCQLHRFLVLHNSPIDTTEKCCENDSNRVHDKLDYYVLN